MADDVVTIAEFAQFVSRIDERFEHVDERFEEVKQRFASMGADMAEFRSEVRTELRSQRMLMVMLHGPLSVGVAVAIIGVAAKYVFS